MVINLLGAKPAQDAGEALLQTSLTPLTIPEMFASARARFGEQVGYQQKVRGEWETLTYEETWRQARDFAAGLVALGLEKGDRVAVMCENGLPWVVGMYGLYMAGGVIVPLYVELTSVEAEELIDRAGARIIIASAKPLERLGDSLGNVEHVIVVGETDAREGQSPRFLRRGRPSVLPFDQCAAQATEQSRAALEERRTVPDDLASIMFTSGTTGGMKGVMLTHKNLMANVESTRRCVQAEEKDRLLLVLPIHHAFPFTMLHTSTAVGAELTFENDLLRVRDRMQEVKPTIFLGVPALFEQMYRTILRRAESEGRMELFQRGLRVVDVAKRRTGVNLGRLVFREIHQLLGGQLRIIFCGGAALKPETARAFFRLGLPLLQGWGLTEAAPAVAAQRVNTRKFLFSNYFEEQVGTVGQPLDGVEVKLIDVPEKEIYVHLHGEGELVVRGPNVFAGYWQAPEETNAAMAGEWLRTGDLGRIDSEGNIWITGRSKYIIVLDSGEKVVPDELEGRYGQSALLEDVCVVPRRNRNKTQVGMIVYPSLEEAQARLDGEMSEAAVRKLVQEEVDSIARDLAAYKRIGELMLSDTPLPKTALQDIARGQVAETYSFDVETWQQQAPAPPAQPEAEPASS
ncbi:MAG: AMP-binding protein [Chloroflexi bacterium]|nr:AMP-binding protein [Chloroflexota bacterium]